MYHGDRMQSHPVHRRTCARIHQKIHTFFLKYNMINTTSRLLPIALSSTGQSQTFNRRHSRSYTFKRMASLFFLLFFMSTFTPVVAQPPESTNADRPNVLFIAVDDLRPQLNTYGRSQMRTPNIDRLAESGTRFERAYCNVPVCGASRASLMTGLRPTRQRFATYDTRAEDDAPGIPALNDHFQQHGYHTSSFGKVFHHRDDHADGWDVNWRSDRSWTGYVTKKNIERTQNPSNSRGYPYERADRPEKDYLDAGVARKAIDQMEQRSKEDRPWFLAVGFWKPHLPFAAPEKYWQMYDPSDIHLPPNYNAPKNAPGSALHSFGELRNYRDVPESGPVSDQMARTLIHGYYACTSFVDAQIGRLLDRLSDLGMRDNTIVVLWGDHGWQLGEHGLWCKHSVFETSMQVPLIVRAPGASTTRNSDRLVELLDLYPTLCDLAGLSKPDHLDGRSVEPLLHNPNQPWKQAVTGRFHNWDTMRTPRYRYSFQRNENGDVVADMLYDHQVDPAETVNIASRDDTKQERKVLRNVLQQRIHDRDPVKSGK